MHIVVCICLAVCACGPLTSTRQALEASYLASRACCWTVHNLQLQEGQVLLGVGLLCSVALWVCDLQAQQVF